MQLRHFFTPWLPTVKRLPRFVGLFRILTRTPRTVIYSLCKNINKLTNMNDEGNKRWRKILYEDQGVPDNYVDESFLDEMKKNRT